MNGKRRRYAEMDNDELADEYRSDKPATFFLTDEIVDRFEDLIDDD